MSYNELPFGLSQQQTLSKLTNQDLRDLGKCASDMYLSGSCSLNDAVVKIARDNSGITYDQVRRILEFANTNTFQNIFEKQAGDKNVEFPLADPKVIFRKLSSLVEPTVIKTSSQEYAKSPVKLNNKVDEIYSDIKLAQEFNINPTTPSIEKVSSMPGMIKNLAIGAGIGATISALGTGVGKLTSTGEKQQVLSDAISGAMSGASNYYPQDSYSYDNYDNSNDGYFQESEMKTSSDSLSKLLSKFDKGSDFFKEAVLHVKLGKKGSDRVISDLEKSVSIENIKIATKDVGSYPQVDPFGDLFRMKQTIVKLSEDAKYAAIKNKAMIKDAAEQLHNEVSNHILQGVNFGEIVHAMNHVGEAHMVKAAVAEIAPLLARRGFNLTKLSASMIPYEMSKLAARQPNLDSNLLKVFSAFVKLSEEQPKLEIMAVKLAQALDNIESRVKKVLEVPNVATRM